MIDPRRTGALADFLVDRLVTVHGGEPDTGGPDVGLPPELRIVELHPVPFFVQPDPDDPASGRMPMADTVLLSACVALHVADTGAADAAVHAFRTDPSTPTDLRVGATSDGTMQVWLDRRMPSTVSTEVATALLDEFVEQAIRLRASVADLDLRTSPDARERAETGGFTEPISYDYVDGSEWSTHPWLSRLEWKSDMDCDRWFCLFELGSGATALFDRITLEYELVDGTWETVRPAIPGPIMPAVGWARPAVAWCDLSQWSSRNGKPDSPTGRWRAKVPTGWSGPPV